MRVRRIALIVLAVCCVPFASGAAAQSTADEPEPDSLCGLHQPGVVYGTPRDDKIVGTNGDDIVCALAGDDDVDGKGGNDVVYGGAGNDVLTGGAGNDQLYGEAGDDRLDGASDDDGLFGGDGNDSLTGSSGTDGLVGGPGDDDLSAGSGDDGLDGGPGNDSLSAAEGADVVDGGEGNDTLDAAGGTDVCSNGETQSNCEADERALETPTSPIGITRPVAAPQTITIDDAFPGVKLTVDTNGGIYPWDVHIAPSHRSMLGRVGSAFAGPAFDISVPESAPAIDGAQLTLPYDQGHIGGSTESALRIWTFDEARQLWVPVPGTQTVDAAANTVTASLTHFSVYAVFKNLTPDEWREIFAQTPLLCVGGTGGALDVVFLIDTSGSMSTNDPTGLRVDAAKAFVDEMRSEDRAAVVGFNGFATREIGLTQLRTNTDVTAVKDALERTRIAVDGTDISDAVREAIAIYAASAEPNRRRVAILLTDGVSPYDTTLTAQAAQNLIEIHTVSLGSSTNPSLLQAIATGTGGTFQHLDDPAQLPALYEQLAGDIIGDSEDTDGDGLSDCVERNGMFVPFHITIPFVDVDIDFASFIMTDPKKRDTDGDGLSDGAEVEAHNLVGDPVLASVYDFLVDDGLRTYFTLDSDPTKRDSDGDGVDDGIEFLNGTNPLVDDSSELGIPGLPRFTLFQPDRYAERPAIRRRLELDGDTIRSIYYNDVPVRYDGDRNCVETCDAIRELAEARPDGNGICIFGIGDCATDESQMRDIVESAREDQEIFDGDGFLEERFLQEQAALECAMWFAEAQRCFDEAENLDFADDLGPDLYGAAVAAVARGFPGTANPVTAEQIARALAQTAALVAAGITAAEITRTIARCIEGPALRIIQEIVEAIVPFVHPCEAQPIYSPGDDVGTATDHRVRAIAANPLRVAESWASPAERAARPFGRQWYLGQPGCTAADRAAAEARHGVAVSCDEFPNWSMDRAGPGASLEYLPAADNTGEGVRLNVFYGACPEVTAAARNNRALFLVVPDPLAPVTLFTCGR